MTERAGGRAATTVWSDTAGPEDAPAVVLVHGSMDRSAGLLRLSRRLVGDFRVVRYDRRGYGRSHSLPAPYTVAQHVEDLAEVVEQTSAGGPVALVFGHSFGGNVALALAQRRPDLIERVAVYESPQPWRTAARREQDAEPPEERSAADDAERFMRALIGDTLWERLPSGARAARRAEGEVLRAELADLGRRAPWSPAQLDHPIMAIAGALGADRHRASMRALAEDVTGARFVEIAGAGHLGPNTHSAAVADLLGRFVTTTPARSRPAP